MYLFMMKTRVPKNPVGMPKEDYRMETVYTAPVGAWWASIVSLLFFILFLVVIGLGIAALIKYLRTPSR